MASRRWRQDCLEALQARSSQTYTRSRLSLYGRKVRSAWVGPAPPPDSLDTGRVKTGNRHITRGWSPDLFFTLSPPSLSKPTTYPSLKPRTPQELPWGCSACARTFYLEIRASHFPSPLQRLSRFIASRQLNVLSVKRHKHEDTHGDRHLRRSDAWACADGEDDDPEGPLVLAKSNLVFLNLDSCLLLRQNIWMAVNSCLRPATTFPCRSHFMSANAVTCRRSALSASMSPYFPGCCCTSRWGQ